MPQSWLDSRIEVRPSSIHGLGLFATQAIAKGTVVMRWQGMVLPIDALEELKTLPRYDCATLSATTILVFEESDPITRGNHSCDPNLWMEGARAESTLRDVAAGQELTVDYSVHSDDPAWRMECACGSVYCRHIVTGVDWMRPDLQERYRSHFSPHLSSRFMQLSERRNTP